MKPRKNDCKKSCTLRLDPILRKASDMRPDACIVGGSVSQDFQLDKYEVT